MELHIELGELMWDYVGMARNEKGLKLVLEKLPELKKEFWNNINVPGSDKNLNKALEFAGRLYDFIELGELMALDALHRNESCGGHFREEYQTPEGEALRDDEHFSYVAGWEYPGNDEDTPILHKEPLVFENVKPTQRSYK